MTLKGPQMQTWHYLSGQSASPVQPRDPSDRVTRVVELLFEYRFSRDTRERSYLGQSKPRRCRICGRAGAQATFRKKAHVIPQALGNRTLLTHEECDSCNQDLGSPLESALSNFLAVPRVLGCVRTRSGRSKLKPRNLASIEANAESYEMLFQTNEEDPSITFERLSDHEVRFSAKLPPTNRMDASRALARMALLSVPSQHLEELGYILKWVWREAPLNPTLGLAIQDRSPLTSIFGVFRYADEDGEPVFMVVLSFASFIVTLDLPKSSGSPLLRPPREYFTALFQDLLRGPLQVSLQFDFPDQVETELTYEGVISHEGSNLVDFSNLPSWLRDKVRPADTNQN